VKKTILITGSTDGIGLVTAKTLFDSGHTVLLHGRSEAKLSAAKSHLIGPSGQARVETYKADLSVIDEVKTLASAVRENHQRIDVLINNAGVFIVPETVSADGLDIRFVVNTIAPYLLTQQLLPLLGSTGRVVNLSSAAQAPVDPDELATASKLDDGPVYAKSKLALTMWSRQMALSLGSNGPVIVAVNPASFLGSKMVKLAYGVAGGDLQKGADILIRAALSEEFADASGLYFDNDKGQFTAPHQDASNLEKTAAITNKIEEILADFE
jgi:NAD(P)-dependent dehydrogenase (short-subunit alcohol dehydrogenase family)